MMRCFIYAAQCFGWYKQQFNSKCYVQSFYYISQVMSKHLRVYTNSVQDQGVNESSLVKVGKDVGLQPQSLLKAAECSPLLSQVSLEQLRCFFSCMEENGLNCELGLAMLTESVSFLTLNPTKLSERIELWRRCQLGEENLKRLLLSHVNFLLIPTREIDRRIPFLKNLCNTKQNLYNLLQNCPLIMSESWTAVQKKIVYLQTVMKVENVKIVKSMALNQPLDIIQTRHIFLVRCGRYVVPNPKVDPSVATKNPSLSKITDTSDKDFATKVAGLSLEEYEVFCELFAEEIKEESSSYDSDSDNEEQ